MRIFAVSQHKRSNRFMNRINPRLVSTSKVLPTLITSFKWQTTRYTLLTCAPLANSSSLIRLPFACSLPQWNWKQTSSSTRGFSSFSQTPPPSSACHQDVELARYNSRALENEPRQVLLGAGGDDGEPPLQGVTSLFAMLLFSPCVVAIIIVSIQEILNNRYNSREMVTLHTESTKRCVNFEHVLVCASLPAFFAQLQ